MYSVYDSFHSWKSLKELDLQENKQPIPHLQEEDVKSFVYNLINYSTYQKAWDQCETQLSSSRHCPYFYEESMLSQFFCAQSEMDESLMKCVESDVSLLVIVSMTPLGRIHFLPLLQKMESLLICLLGHVHSRIRFIATILLNMLYRFVLSLI